MATIIGDLLYDTQLDPHGLADLASLYPSAVAQRTGYLIDLIASETETEIDTEPLRRAVRGCRYRELSPGHSGGDHDERWHVIVNTAIEHDL